MTRKLLVIPAIFLGLAIGGISTAEAPSAKACEKQIRLYSQGCKFSPTAWLIGMCTVKETLKACKDRKKHDKAFHK